MRELLKEMKAEIIDTLTLKMNDLDAKLVHITGITTTHTNQINDHETRITQLETDLKQVIEEQKKIITKQDDQLNRSLRNNLVLKNVKGTDKTPEESKTLAATMLCEFNGIKNPTPNDIQYHENAIERAHRMMGKEDKEEDKDDGRPKPLVMRLYCSESVGYYEKKARLLRIQDKRYSVFASQQYSDLLTDRRNQAMIKRRELIDAGTYDSGFVTYPARLMMKTKNEKKYKQFQCF